MVNSPKNNCAISERDASFKVRIKQYADNKVTVQQPWFHWCNPHQIYFHLQVFITLPIQISHTTERIHGHRETRKQFHKKNQQSLQEVTKIFNRSYNWPDFEADELIRRQSSDIAQAQTTNIKNQTPTQKNPWKETSRQIIQWHKSALTSKL